jgi:hypothetical protein
MIYDETNYITGVAIANPSGAATTVNITVTDNTGTVIGTATVDLPARNKTAVALRNLPGLSSVVGKQGTVRFSTTSGPVSVLGLRFKGSAFTSIPTQPQSQILKFIGTP